MTTTADEHPRGSLLYSTHCVYIPSFSNFSYFFSSGLKTRAKRLCPSPNKSPHTEVNNTNTAVAGVRAGALLKLIFQNVFLLLLQLQGRSAIGYVPFPQQRQCGMGLKAGKSDVGDADKVCEPPGVGTTVGDHLGTENQGKVLSRPFPQASQLLPAFLAAQPQNHEPLKPLADAPRLTWNPTWSSGPQLNASQKHGFIPRFLLPERSLQKVETMQGHSLCLQPPGCHTCLMRAGTQSPLRNTGEGCAPGFEARWPGSASAWTLNQPAQHTILPSCPAPLPLVIGLPAICSWRVLVTLCALDSSSIAGLRVHIPIVETQPCELMKIYRSTHGLSLWVPLTGQLWDGRIPATSNGAKADKKTKEGWEEQQGASVHITHE